MLNWKGRRLYYNWKKGSLWAETGFKGLAQETVKYFGGPWFSPCRSDPGLVVKIEKDGKRVYITTYVDDLLILADSLSKVQGIKD